MLFRSEPGFRAALERNLREKNGYLQALLGEPPLAFDDIHDRYRGYRERLSELVGAPVLLLSVGPQREQTIRLGDVF